ncbi:MAG: transcription elongation factor Spt5 [Euryarchaeota archaeon]|nr:transcription elongation factor Spt5 [Euryarchaeota archaeon]
MRGQKQVKWSDELVLEKIRALAQTGSVNLERVRREDNRLLMAARHRFGCWENAVKAAGLKYDEARLTPPPKWSKETILKEVLEVVRTRGEDFRGITRVNKSLYTAAQTHFGSWQKAIEAARSFESTGALPTMKVFTLKTSFGKEEEVAEAVQIRARTHRGMKMGKVISTPRLRGYLFIEAMDENELINLTSGIRHARGVIGQASQDEIRNFLVPEVPTEDLKEGDLVDVIKGDLKGEVGRIKRIGPGDDVALELVNAIVPLTVNVKLEQLKKSIHG